MNHNDSPPCYHYQPSLTMINHPQPPTTMTHHEELQWPNARTSLHCEISVAESGELKLSNCSSLSHSDPVRTVHVCKRICKYEQMKNVCAMRRSICKYDQTHANISMQTLTMNHAITWIASADHWPLRPVKVVVDCRVPTWSSSGPLVFDFLRHPLDIL